MYRITCLKVGNSNLTLALTTGFSPYIKMNSIAGFSAVDDGAVKNPIIITIISLK